MSLSVNVGYTDTAIAGNPTLNLERGKVNFGADFRVKSFDVNKEKKTVDLVLTNLSSPVSRPELFKFSVGEVANVYSGTAIDASVYAPTKKGVSILCQLDEVFSLTDSEDATFRRDLPMHAHLVLRIPDDENITADTIQTFVARLLSGLYETGLTTTSRISSLVHGSLTPADL